MAVPHDASEAILRNDSQAHSTYGWLVARDELVENVGLNEARLAGASVADQNDLERLLRTLFDLVRHRCSGVFC